jgi:hypothetical protein
MSNAGVFHPRHKWGVPAFSQLAPYKKAIVLTIFDEQHP